MEQIIACPSCGARVRLPDDFDAPAAQCPMCQRVFNPRDLPARSESTPRPAAVSVEQRYQASDDLDFVPREPSNLPLPSGTLAGMGRARIARAFLLFSMVTGGLSAFASLLVWHYVNRIAHGEQVDPGLANTLDTFGLGVGLANLAVYIGCVITVCMWTYSAYWNLHMLNIADNRFTPSMAVWAYFIPFVNLVRPVQVMGEMWRASDPESFSSTGWQQQPGSAMAGSWWAAWIVSNVLSNISFRLSSEQHPDIQTILAANFTNFIAEAISIIAAWLLYMLIGGVMRRQTLKFRVLRSDAAGGDDDMDWSK